MPKGDKQQLKADIEDGYWPVANLISEMLPKANLTGTQHRLLWVLFNRTYRWKRKQAAISLPSWAAAIGISSTSHISAQLKDLAQEKVILRTISAGKTAEYEFNTHFAEWKPGILEGVQWELKGTVETEPFSQNRTLQSEQNPSVGTEQKGTVGTEGYPSVGTEGSRAGNADEEELAGTPKELVLKTSTKTDLLVPTDAGTHQPEKLKFDETSTPYHLAVHLRDAILTRDSSTKVPANLQKWAVEADRLLRIDKRDPEEVAVLITWCQQDSFWSTNILSMGKFREKYDQLKLKQKTMQTRAAPPNKASPMDLKVLKQFQKEREEEERDQHEG